MSGRVSAPHPGGLGTARLELPVKLDSRLHVKGGTSLKVNARLRMTVQLRASVSGHPARLLIGTSTRNVFVRPNL